MKTIRQIKADIDQVIEEIRVAGLTTKPEASMIAHLHELQTLLAYAETNPSEEYLVRERTRLERLINENKKRYEWWSKNCAPADVEPKHMRAHYNRISGTNEFEKKLRAINYLLG